jgi:hypothetical protein
MAAFYACSAATTLAILFGYAALLRLVGGARLKRALSYLQMLLSFLMYGGFFLVQQAGLSGDLREATLAKSGWVLLVPSAWFATYLEIGAGTAGVLEVALAAGSAGLLLVMIASLGRRLSLDYSARLGEIVSAAQAPRTPAARGTRRGRWFRAGEARAVALLIGSQFRNDQKFRMAVLAILPLTILYVFMGAFDSRATGTGRFALVNVAVLIFPSMLNMALKRSDHFRASWIFFAAPADRARLIRASQNVLVVLFLAPYLGFITAVFLWLLRTPLQVAAHVLLLGLLSHLVLQIVVLMDPALPFSQPNQPMRRSGSFIVFIVVLGMTTGLIQLVGRYLTSSVRAALVTYAAVASVSVLVDRLTRARIHRQAQQLEFEG